MDNPAQIMSSYQRRINRIKLQLFNLQNINLLRKKQITQFNLLIKKLLKEERITKSEIEQFITKKKFN